MKYLQIIYNKFTFLIYYSITFYIKINRSDKRSQKMVKYFKYYHRSCSRFKYKLQIPKKDGLRTLIKEKPLGTSP